MGLEADSAIVRRQVVANTSSPGAASAASASSAEGTPAGTPTSTNPTTTQRSSSLPVSSQVETSTATASASRPASSQITDSVTASSSGSGSSAANIVASSQSSSPTAPPGDTSTSPIASTSSPSSQSNSPSSPPPSPSSTASSTASSPPTSSPTSPPSTSNTSTSPDPLTSTTSTPTPTSSPTTSPTITSVTTTSSSSERSSTLSSTPPTSSLDSSSTNGVTTSRNSETAASRTSPILTTITSSIVTTVNGQATTIITTIPTSLNSAPENPPTTHAGVIAGAAIGGTLLLLLALAGMFLLHRRQALRKVALAHRSLPTPRSALLAGEDGFDLSGPSFLPMREGAPQLLRPRGQGTGSIFHEGVWPPPSESSRLEDPLLAGSYVDLSSIVDDVMGQHDRSSSGASLGSTMPLLANTSPSRDGRHPLAESTFATSAPKSAWRGSGHASLPSESTPLDPHGRHAQQSSLDSTFGSPHLENVPLPPGAAPPSPPGRPAFIFSDIASTTRSGTLPSNARAPQNLGSLVVVNPETEDQDNPLVDVGPSRSDPPKEIPPLYHTIVQDTDATPEPSGSNGQNINISPAGDSSLK